MSVKVQEADVGWLKSSFSEQNGACIELALSEGAILLRESDVPGVVVRTTPGKLYALLAGAKSGALDSSL
ncbi:DUF397 domain-containing protein [Streptomyces gamaensis]|uniref:DUF397 domain-containing protein n=1 Tax=Streptomyces gamaensis TaxID=1763542 RepID=A0ABW0YVH5_9ACTN